MVMLYWFLLIDLNPRLKWCRNKRQFKDIPSNTCLNVSREQNIRSKWLLTQVQYQHFVARFVCFYVAKTLMPILPLLPVLCVCEKLDYWNETVAYRYTAQSPQKIFRGGLEGELKTGKISKVPYFREGSWSVVPPQLLSQRTLNPNFDEEGVFLLDIYQWTTEFWQYSSPASCGCVHHR